MDKKNQNEILAKKETDSLNKILIVDDDRKIVYIISEVLKNNGFSPKGAYCAMDALEIFKKEIFDAVLLDIKMPGMNGIDAIREFKNISAEIPIIIITAYTDIQTAVKVIKLGAYDFITKPLDFDNLIIVLKRAVERVGLEREVKRLSTTIESYLEGLLGSGKAIRGVIEQIYHVAKTNFSVIIQGETGVGKSIVARSLHDISRRAKAPFVTLDMGVIPETIIESELFGYEKGAFTGAERSKKGYLEIANGGTIFLDELENMSPHMQSKILRVCDEKKICPLGSTREIDVDVRIIAATNKNIGKELEDRRFREDLFFRLGEFIIIIPPLRERIEDIPFFARKFLQEAANELNRIVYELTDKAEDYLKRYPWPGNVRELKNVIKRSLLQSPTGIIRQENLKFLFYDKFKDKSKTALLPLKEVSAFTIRDAEKKAIMQVLEWTNGNKTKAASILQIDYKTLLVKIKKYNIT
jgi:DNA-binding NtrC family response regulator